MRRLILSLAVSSLLALDAHGQLSVQVRAEKDTYLLYESIPVSVSIHNGSGRTIEIQSEGGQPWLRFVVSQTSGSLVAAVGKPGADESALIPPGQTVSRTVDVLPLYELRARGNYQVQAVVDASGSQVISAPIKLTITNGRELWSQTVGLPVSAKGPDEYRTYSLVARSGPERDLLHICIKDEVHQTVYGLIPLGGFLTVSKPTTQVDGQGQLHVLYQSAPRSFGYVHVDPFAKIVAQAAYSDFLSRPRMVNEGGSVNIRGGEQVYPKPDRIMSNEEINPPPEPPPKSKNKWWWPFGQKKTPAQ